VGSPSTAPQVRPSSRLVLEVRPAPDGDFARIGYLAVLAGVALHVAITWSRHGDAAGGLITALAACFTAFVWATATALLLGRVTLVYLHMCAAAAAGVWCSAVALGRQPPAYLASALVGLLLVGALGRIGCHRAGCCLGRPARRGVMYRADPDAFSPHPVARVPVQLVEGGTNAALVVVTSALILGGHGEAEVIGLGVAAYSAMRLVLELWREPAGRASLLGINHTVPTAYPLLVGASLLMWPSPASVPALVGGTVALGVHLARATARRI
jgi:prolipoprotein diacylglyceryltransferase